MIIIFQDCLFGSGNYSSSLAGNIWESQNKKNKN